MKVPDPGNEMPPAGLGRRAVAFFHVAMSERERGRKGRGTNVHRPCPATRLRAKRRLTPNRDQKQKADQAESLAHKTLRCSGEWRDRRAGREAYMRHSVGNEK